MDSSLSKDVQMQFMRPRQLEDALRAFPAVYVPFGLIEWHGRHLPLGNDALKAHTILVKCAERFGGVEASRRNLPGADGLMICEYGEIVTSAFFRQSPRNDKYRPST